MRRHDCLTRDWLAVLGRALDLYEAAGPTPTAADETALEETAIICGWSFVPDGETAPRARATLGRPAPATP